MDLKILSETAAALFVEHGLVGWTFGLTAAKRRLGVCKYRRKRIEIGDYYARNNSDAAVQDTLLHEIAHALAGPAAKHGPKWKAVAVRLGASPQACDKSPETIAPPADWRATCPACQKTYHRYRRPMQKYLKQNLLHRLSHRLSHRQDHRRPRHPRRHCRGRRRPALPSPGA